MYQTLRCLLCSVWLPFSILAHSSGGQIGNLSLMARCLLSLPHQGSGEGFQGPVTIPWSRNQEAELSFNSKGKVVVRVENRTVDLSDLAKQDKFELAMQNALAVTALNYQFNLSAISSTSKSKKSLFRNNCLGDKIRSRTFRSFAQAINKSLETSAKGQKNSDYGNTL
jgi:hypothetical protein